MRKCLSCQTDLLAKFGEPSVMQISELRFAGSLKFPGFFFTKLHQILHNVAQYCATLHNVIQYCEMLCNVMQYRSMSRNIVCVARCPTMSGLQTLMCRNKLPNLAWILIRVYMVHSSQCKYNVCSWKTWIFREVSPRFSKSRAICTKNMLHECKKMWSWIPHP